MRRGSMIVLMMIMFMVPAVILGAQEAPPATETATEGSTQPATPEQLVDTLKENETVTVEVETTEKGRSIVNLKIEVPYEANVLRRARELALKYAKAFFTQKDIPVDALHMEFTNVYTGKILEIQLGRDRLYLKMRRRVRPLIQWDKMTDHVKFFMKLRELEKHGEGPFDSVWYKARLYPEDWPQNEVLFGPSKADQSEP